MQRIMWVNLCMSSCWDVHAFVVPVLGHERNFSASVIGAILGAFAISAAVVRVIMPVFASHLREHVVLASAMLVTAMVFLAYPFMDLPLADGGLLRGPGPVARIGAAHDHERPAPDHAAGAAGRGAGLAADGHQRLQCRHADVSGTIGTVVGVSVVFWAVGAAVAVGARPAWLLRPPAGHAPQPGPDNA